jgi:hypothetical protein
MGMFGASAASGVFGLYELSGDGKVLYSRPRREGRLGDPVPETVGQDFFHDIASFDNTEDLRRQFSRFLSDGSPVDSFVFDFLFEAEVVRTQICLARAYEVDKDQEKDIVIMDIRRAGPPAGGSTKKGEKYEYQW